MCDTFIFDAFDDGLVVMPISEARRLAALNDALESSSTWGEFFARIANDAETQADVKDQYEGRLPSPDDPFDADELSGFAEYDWPTWPKQAMLDWLPASVKNLGICESTLTTGPFLHLDEGLGDKVIEALAEEGVECHQDSEDVVIRACGAWRHPELSAGLSPDIDLLWVVPDDRPIYYLWVFDPQDGKIYIDHNEGRQAGEKLLHDTLAPHVTHPERIYGYAYSIPGGWRLTNDDHDRVENDFAVSQVLNALKQKHPPSLPDTSEETDP